MKPTLENMIQNKINRDLELKESEMKKKYKGDVAEIEMLKSNLKSKMDKLDLRLSKQGFQYSEYGGVRVQPSYQIVLPKDVRKMLIQIQTLNNLGTKKYRKQASEIKDKLVKRYKLIEGV